MVEKRVGRRKGSGRKTIFEKKNVKNKQIYQTETLSETGKVSLVLRNSIDHMCYNLRKKLRCENSTLDEITMSQEILALTQKIHNLDKKIKELENEQK